MKPYYFILASVVFPVACIAAPFQNGSFESPQPAAPIPNNNYIATAAFNPPGQDATGWTVTGNCGVFTGRGIFQNFGAVDGYQQLNFNGGNTTPNGVARQTFDTVVGKSYVVSFWAGRVSTGGGVVKVTVRVQAANNSTLEVIEGAPAAGAGYVHYQFTFEAESTTSTLSITDSSASPATNVDIVVDAVSVYPVEQVASAAVVQYSVAASVVGNTGSLYRIDATDELATIPANSNWRILTYITLPASPYQFLDPNSTGKNMRFYRITPLTATPP